MLRTGSAVADGTGSTRRTRGDVPWCLDVEPPLAIDQHLGADHQLGQAHERGRALTTVQHGQGSLLLQTSNIRRIARPLAALVDPMNPDRSSPAPTRHREEPHNVEQFLQGSGDGENGMGSVVGQSVVIALAVAA